MKRTITLIAVVTLMNAAAIGILSYRYSLTKTELALLTVSVCVEPERGIWL